MKHVLLPACMAVLAFAWALPASAQPAPDVPPAEGPAEPPTADEADGTPVSSPTLPTPAIDSSARAPSAAQPNEGRTVIVPESASLSASDRTTEEEGPARLDLVRINMGLRVAYLPVGLTGYEPSRGFDTFASNDVLTQFSIDGNYPIVTRGRLVLGAGLGWDVGGRSSRVRGLESSLTAHRLYVPIEGRYHVSPGLFVFGKVSPGAAVALASVKDPSVPDELSGSGWAFSADASIGGSILLGPRRRMDKRTVRFWITPEIGYAYTTNAPLRVNPGRPEKDILGSDEDTKLGTVAFSGFFWRASVGTTF